MHNYSCTMMKMNDLKNVKESQFTNTITFTLVKSSLDFTCVDLQPLDHEKSTSLLLLEASSIGTQPG